MDNEISLWSLSDMLGMHKTEPQMWSKWNKVAAGAQGAKWTMVRKDRDTGHWDTRAHCRGINQWRMDRSRRKWELPKKYTQRTGNSWQEDRCGHVSWIENESARTPGPGSRTQDSGLWTLDSGLSYATTSFRCLQWRVKTKDCGPRSTLLEKVTSPDLLCRQDILRT